LLLLSPVVVELLSLLEVVVLPASAVEVVFVAIDCSEEGDEDGAIDGSEEGDEDGAGVGAAEVGAAVVGGTVVGATVVGAAVVGGTVVGTAVVGGAVVGAAVTGTEGGGTGIGVGGSVGVGRLSTSHPNCPGATSVHRRFDSSVSSQERN